MNEQGHTNELVQHADPIAGDVLSEAGDAMLARAYHEGPEPFDPMTMDEPPVDPFPIERPLHDQAHHALRKLMAWCDDERAKAETERVKHTPGSFDWCKWAARGKAMADAAIRALEIITGVAK